MNVRKQGQALVIGSAGLSLFFAATLHATTPSEMAELSLQELLAMSTDEESGKTNPWSTSVLYTRRKLEGYLDGRTEVSNDEVQFFPGGTRTDKNFPVVPTTITQEALIASIRYQINPTRTLSFSVPYIRQSTDHESIVPGYSTFNITSEGLGDLSSSYSQTFKTWDAAQMSYSIGLSAPTGSIDEKGNTPRTTGDDQLPYTMQLGSGTWDIPAGLHYQQEKVGWAWGGNLFAKVRLGRNDRNYRLGNSYATSLWARHFTHRLFRPSAKISYRYWDKIHGRDEELLVPGAFPYPAGITNPDFYGGEKIDITLGSEIGSKKQSLDFQIGMPLYQSLNGIQPKEVMHFSMSWNFSF